MLFHFFECSMREANPSSFQYGGKINRKFILKLFWPFYPIFLVTRHATSFRMYVLGSLPTVQFFPAKIIFPPSSDFCDNIELEFPPALTLHT